jgi:hypothetical protein
LTLRGNSKLTSREISSLPMLELTEHLDGTGTITFDSEDFSYSVFRRKRGWGTLTPTSGTSAQFFHIADPRRVYQLIRDQVAS